VLTLRGLGFALRVTANLVREAGKLLGVFYDVLIFAPLAVERWIASARANGAKGEAVEAKIPLGKLRARTEEAA
jgi:hypothetical protein